MANTASHNQTQFHVGDTVRVNYRLIEKETVAGKAKREVKEEIRERIQAFEGVVLSIRGNEPENKMFTVRRIGVGSIGIERIFPLISPWIKTIDVVKKASVRRAKLYYLRHKTVKELDRLKEKQESTVKVPEKKAEKKKAPEKKTSSEKPSAKKETAKKKASGKKHAAAASKK